MLLHQDPNKSYDNFVKTFSGIYDIAFHRKNINIKQKDLNNFWITKGLPKPSKKQKLYEKSLKKRTVQNENKYDLLKSIPKNKKRF